MLEEFLKTHHVDPAAKYRYNDYNVVYEPITNYLDVSINTIRNVYVSLFLLSLLSAFIRIL